MSRSGGYKCYNIQCGSCIGKTLCGEPGEDALSCADRIVPRKTNADLLARAEAAEARAEKAEKQLEALLTVILGKPIMATGQREVITFCGVPVDEAMDRVVDYPILKEKLEKAERCIDAIEDDLDRGNDNDWAREHIAEWREEKGNHQ